MNFASLILFFLWKGIFFKDVFIYYSVSPACMPAGLKRAPDLIINGCELTCDCLELNSGYLEE